MKCLLFVILAGCAVKCDDNNYYVIEMPEDRLEDQGRQFSVYWNVPTMQCRSKKIPFENLYEKYGILQNKNDSFRGEEISILYDPGLFPALLKNETSGKFKFRNGGVPQEGNLELHLETFRSVLDQSIPDPDFHGVGIIDFESWRPIFRQNFGVLVPYKDISIEIEKKMHWWWPKQWIQAEAKQRFEEAARTFMQTTLSVAKQMRPRAVWGYYGFPYCFNMANKHMKETCADKVPEENDRTYWLWSESTALYPSVYSSKDLTSSQLAGLIRGRVNEAERVKRKGTQVLPYFWFRYREGGYLSEEDLQTALETLYKSNASGFIIWGSSNDVNTVAKCKKLQQYLDKTLGPAIAAFTKPSTKLRDEIPPTPTERTTTKIPDVQTYHDDPEFHWEPPENYAQDIKNYVEEEIKRKGYNFTKANETMMNLNDSILMEVILNSLIERNITKNEMKGLPYVDITTDSDGTSHDTYASQPVELSTGIVQNKDKDTNIFYSTESLPKEVINSQTVTKDSSPDDSVTKLLQKYQHTPESSLTSSTELPYQYTSHISNTDFVVTKLLQNEKVTTEMPYLETLKTADLKESTQKHLNTDFSELQDDLKKEATELIFEPLPPDFLKLNEKLSSMEITTESQYKQTPSLSTDSLSIELIGNVKETSYKPNTDDLVAKLLQRETTSTELISSENSGKIFTEEYLTTNSQLSNLKETQDSSTHSTTEYTNNHKNTVAEALSKGNEKDSSESTTLETLITKPSDNIVTSDIYSDYPYYYEEKQTEFAITENYTESSNSSDFQASIDDKFGSDYKETDKNSEELDNGLNAFFNQDTFLDNTESPEEKNTVSAANLTKNEVFDRLEDDIHMKEDTDTTIASTTELDQVAGSGSRVSVLFRHYLCVYYFYSVVKCLCAVFGMC